MINVKDVFLHSSSKLINGKIDYGIIKSDGKRVLEGDLIRRNSVINSAHIDEKDLVDVTIIDEEVIFGGYIFHHFGHFLLETLSRIQAIEKFSGTVVFASPTPTLAKYQLAIFKILGVKNIKVLNGTFFLKKIVIPESKYIIGKGDLGDFFLTLEKKLQNKFISRESIFYGKKIWLSRSNLKHRNIVNENQLENLLQQDGWLVIHPEEMDIFKQLEVLSNARQVAGFSGSAFHLIILVAPPYPELKILQLEDTINDNYLNIAKSKGLDQKVIDINIRSKNTESYIKCYWELEHDQCKALFNFLKER